MIPRDVSHKDRELPRYTREQIERKTWTVRQCQEQIARINASVDEARKLWGKHSSIIVDVLLEDIKLWVDALRVATAAGHR